MRPKKYRLEIVLDFREKKKQEAARFVALRRQELLEEEQELSRRKGILNDCRRQIFEAKKKMMTEFDEGTSAGKIVSHRNYLQDLKEREENLKIAVEEQKINVQKAEQAVEVALEKLTEAYKELKVIEKHKEKWLEDNKKDEHKREQKLNDEIGAILHQRSEKL